MESSRKTYIDFLKFICITCIMLAHVESPDCIKMIRSFDVPMMVMLSSMLGRYSYSKYIGKKNGIIIYWKIRAKRLLIPTWSFLVIYFILQIIFGKIRPIQYYIASFALTRLAIGYVWIIRIYLLSSLLIPLFEKTSKTKKTAFFIVVLYVLYELAYHFGLDSNAFLDNTVFYIIPYGVISYFGYIYSDIGQKCKTIIKYSSLVIFAIIFVLLKNVTGSFQLLEVAKYPPRLYYLSYGVYVSFLLIGICERRQFNFFSNKLIVFVSKHSLPIYLYHILYLNLYSRVLPETEWFLEFVVVYSMSIITTYISNCIIDYVVAKCPKYDFLKYFK
ncbi:MAG: acyltransferase [Firmicutes bacterium]|nr:acyltransferase [Candidatus Colivicinus equi]